LPQTMVPAIAFPVRLHSISAAMKHSKSRFFISPPHGVDVVDGKTAMQARRLIALVIVICD